MGLTPGILSPALGFQRQYTIPADSLRCEWNSTVFTFSAISPQKMETTVLRKRRFRAELSNANLRKDFEPGAALASHG
jgi:hypothetical protein